MNENFNDFSFEEKLNIVRFLAESKDVKSEPVDYTVLSVAVLTLALILIVDFFRHKIDDAATGRPFFKAVLESVYRELATLGIVEFGVYLLTKYASGYNKSMKAVFADVHFMLFIAALFNAIESVVLAIATSRVSDRLWVRTEQLDIDNYLELREEFERIDGELRGRTQDRKAETWIRWDSQGLKQIRDGIWDAVTTPNLKRKHHRLLQQVRFHELRVHFLKANDLPLKLKVSDYLKRSELHVLKKMVHITPFAWLLLTGSLNLMYFLMGMVAEVTENLTTVGTAMSAIFFGTLCMVVILGLIVFKKMKSVYSAIIHDKFIDARVSDDSESDSNTTKGKEQLKLFWGGQPKYIIAMIQLGEILFALAASLLIVFPKRINGVINAWHFLIILVVGYSLFLFIMSRTIPRYTLCTSLGQLVDRHRLQETLAAYRLEEIRRKQQILEEVKAAEASYLSKQKRKNPKPAPKYPVIEQDSTLSLKVSQLSESTDENPKRTSVPLALDLAMGNGKTWMDSRTHTRSESSGSDRVLLAELVETKTEDLRSVIPKEKLNYSDREDRMKARRQRRRVVSDGVAAMRLMKPHSLSEAAQSTLSDMDEENVAPKRVSPEVQPPKQRRSSRRKRSLSANAAIELMRKVSSPQDDKALGVRSKRSEKRQVSLHPLMEDIPAPTVSASRLSIPIGRETPRDEVAVSRVPSADSVDAALRNVEDVRSKRVVSFDGIEDPKSVAEEPPRDRQGGDKSRRFDALRNPEDPARIEESSHRTQSHLAGAGHDAEDDDDTVNTAGSEGGHSDVDDIPCAWQAAATTADERPPMWDWLRDFFSGRLYKHMSALFGTMICFFLVGMRIESLLHASNSVTDHENTWELSPKTAFWMETAWLSMFILTSFFIACLCRPAKIALFKRRKSFVAAVLDLFLSATCLTLLMLSEIQRSCTPDVYFCTDEFGNRIGEGVGNIEPFTSLIALRLVRFFVARKLVALKFRRRGQDVKAKETFRLGIYDEQTVHEVHERANGGQSDGSKEMQSKTGTLVELWNFAISMFPDVVRKYGEFSGELLQAMLGLKVVEHLPAMRASTTAKFSSLRQAQGGESDQVALHKTDESQSAPPNVSFAVSRRYSGLPAETQSIILAGKTGKPVRSVSDASLDDRAKTSMDAKTVGETENRAPLAPLEFEVDSFQHATEMATTDALYSANRSFAFVAPNARLIRSMRRCDRKLLPLLDVWTTVDVVMTRYEIVYFDAPTAFEDKKSEQRLDKGVAARQAIVATNGGKGLRLSDVAEGRKVVGHLELSSIFSIQVDRSPPRKSAMDHSIKCQDTEVVPDEFWKSVSNKDSPADFENRKCRWEHVVQDVLVIESLGGMLRLRFYSDLVDTEMNKQRALTELEGDGAIFKNNSLQWCQTVVRLCGRQQFKHQELTHFGDDDGEELRDYIVILDKHNIAQDNTKALHKRAKIRHSISTATLANLLERRSHSSYSTQQDSPSNEKSKSHQQLFSKAHDNWRRQKEDPYDVI